MIQWYKWKTSQNGIKHSGKTTYNKKEFKELLKKEVKLIEFIKEG